MKHDTIAVIDFGGQYAHLIATKVRRSGVLAEIRQPEDPIEAYGNYRGLILSGSPALSSQDEDDAYTKAIFDLEVPILGFCFGHQEIAKHYGGRIDFAGREWGPADLQITREHPLFSGCSRTERVFMSHNDSVVALPEGFEELGHSEAGPGGRAHRNAAIGSDSLHRYGFQFHPEVDDTVNGDRMIENFVKRICGCRATWSMDAYLEEIEARIADQVGDRSVFLLVSGGVDSTVTAQLLNRALGGDRLRLLHIDNGLMRKDESRGVLEILKALGLEQQLEFVDASDAFLAALQGEVDPEAKRAAIGRTFVEVFEREARRLHIDDHLLGQGTIYPDTIETGGTRRADTIKTHHNRVPIIEEMIAAGRVVEPLAELYKVEVRELGSRLGIPSDVLARHPFPGPGLGVRLLCSRGGSEDVTELTRAASSLVTPAGLSALALPIRSVGVKADLRCYEHPVLLAGELPWDDRTRLVARLLKEIPGINRCLWSPSGNLPSTVAARPASTTRDRLDRLRDADHIVMEGLRRHSVYDEIWQCPTVFVPVTWDGRDGELCIVRPVRSARAMTATAAELPPALVEELSRDLAEVPTVVAVAVDLTSKPPGTIEWE